MAIAPAPTAAASRAHRDSCYPRVLAVEAPRRDITGASDTQAIDLSAVDHAAIERMAIAPASTVAASRAHRDNCCPRRLAAEAPRRDIAGASDTQAIDLSAIDHAAIGRMAIAPAPTAAASRAHRDNCCPRMLAVEAPRREFTGSSDTQAMDLSHFDDAAVERIVIAFPPFAVDPRAHHADCNTHVQDVDDSQHDCMFSIGSQAIGSRAIGSRRLPAPHSSIHHLPRRQQLPHQQCAAQTIARAYKVLRRRRAKAWIQVARKQSARAQLPAPLLNVWQLLRCALPLAQPRATLAAVHVCDVPKRRRATTCVQVAREQLTRARLPPLQLSKSQALRQRLPLALPRTTLTAARVCNVLKRHGEMTWALVARKQLTRVPIPQINRVPIPQSSALPPTTADA